MKKRKLFFGLACAFALVFAFAFKPAVYTMASIKAPGSPWQCITSMPVNEWCTPYNTGAQCTFYYIPSGTFELVYQQMPGGSSPGSCVIPLRDPWED